VARWRLQLLAELSIGPAVRHQENADEAKMNKLKRSFHG